MSSHNCNQLYRVIVALLLMLILPATAIAQDGNHDMLVYTITSFDGTRPVSKSFLYDPHTGMSTGIPIKTDSDRFAFSTGGHLAFSSKNESGVEVFVLDSLLTDISPTNISQNPTADDYPLSWSPDGRHLAFTSSSENQGVLIHIWDGKVIINITPNDLEEAAQHYWIYWNADGRLAFTVANQDQNHRHIYIWDGNKVINITPNDADQNTRFIYLGWRIGGQLAFIGSSTRYPYTSDDIYLWDGKTTSKLNQNPLSEVRDLSWSVDGKLAFTTVTDSDTEVFVWDGENFITVNPGLTGWYSHPQWTSDGHLEFMGSDSQIYEWDGQTTAKSSRNSSLHNGFLNWSPDGRWAFVTDTEILSMNPLIHVVDANNQTVLSIEARSTYSSWSSSGHLTMCVLDQVNWGLHVWDGEKVTKVAEGREISAYWLKGTGIGCSSG